MLRAHGVRLAEDMLPAERWALACPALPTCGLALTEAERVRDDIVAAIVERLARWGSSASGSAIRITGCPNGCARPYTGDIGIVGRMPGYYALYVGGDFEGTRLNDGDRRARWRWATSATRSTRSSRSTPPIAPRARVLAISATASGCRRCSRRCARDSRARPHAAD